MPSVKIEKKYTEDEREVVFVMRYVEERSLREIADYLHIPITSVSAILRRDLIRLKKYSAALKNKRVNKLNVARDRSISLMLSCLNHIEKKLEADESGDRELETWEVISFTRVLQGTIKVLDDAEAMRAGKDSDAGSYGSMKKAQTIDAMSIAALPNDVPEELEIDIDLGKHKTITKVVLVDEKDARFDDETYERYETYDDTDSTDEESLDMEYIEDYDLGPTSAEMTADEEDKEMKQMMRRSSRPVPAMMKTEEEFTFL